MTMNQQKNPITQNFSAYNINYLRTSTDAALTRMRRFIPSSSCKFERCILMILVLLLVLFQISQPISYNERVLPGIVVASNQNNIDGMLLHGHDQVDHATLVTKTASRNGGQYHEALWTKANVLNGTEKDRKQSLQSDSTDSQQQKNAVEDNMNPFDNEIMSMDAMRKILLLNESGNDFVLHSNITLSAIHHMYQRKKLPEDFVLEILIRSKKMLQSLPSVVEVDIPPFVKRNSYPTNSRDDSDNDDINKKPPYITVLGDTHGQFYGVMHIFDTYGFPTPTKPYIFNGDMIDTGDFSFSLFISLLMIKLSCPSCIHFTRGNHEMKPYFSQKLEDELQHYGENGGIRLFKTFIETINELPIAILLNGNECRALVMHGGIVAEDTTVEHIMNITRGRQPEYDSFFDHLLWADPQDELGLQSGERGMLFGPDVTKSFLERNKLSLLIRGHSYVRDGYRMEHNDKLITLYSAPIEGHRGALVRVDRDLDTEFHTFASSPYPLVKRWSAFVGFDT